MTGELFIRRSKRQRGLSLVELMVAILIGMIVLAGVVQVMITSKSTFLGQEEMSYIQENARYAMDVIGRDIQNAGYWGCAGAGSAVAMVATADPKPGAVEPGELLRGANAMQSIIGFQGTAQPDLFRDRIRSVANPADGSIQDTPDSFIVRRFSGIEHPVTADNASSFELSEASAFNDGRFLAVIAEDCQRVGVFRAAAVAGTTVTYAGGICSNASLRPTAAGGQICNADCDCPGPDAVQAYRPGSTVTGYSASAYFIGDSPIVRGQPALMRASLLSGGAIIEEVALGIEDMEVLYGQDSNGDQQPDQYLLANEVTQWENVIAVQVSLLFRAQAPGLPQDKDITYLNNKYEDRFVRQVFSSTFRLRNRF